LLIKFLILFIFLGTTFILAFNYNFLDAKMFTNQDLILLSLVLFSLLIYMYIKFKSVNKKQQVEKKDNKDIQNYLSDTIKKSIYEIKELKKISNEIRQNGNLDKLDALFYKENELLYTLKDTEIFLDTITNKSINKIESFNLEKFIKDLSCYCTTGSENKEFNLIAKNSLNYSVIANKELLENIIILVAKLQYQEHNLSEANIGINLSNDNSFIELSVNSFLKMDEKLKQVINDSLKPIYDYDKKRYVGIYLYLISLLVNRYGGKLKIDVNEDNYKIYISIPINIERKDTKAKLLLPSMTESDKKALIISTNKDIANSITSFLLNYNISTDAILSSEIEKTPNFMSYDLLIIDAPLLEPILSDYLISVKKYHDLKIVSIEPNKKSFKYLNGLVDYIIKKPILQSKIYQLIVELYHNKDNNKNIQLENLNDKNNLKTNKENKVLIIENSKVNMKLLKYMIESYGVKVVTASNKEEAFNILENEGKFDLIIIDSSIESNGSCETIQKIRQNSKFNSIPVIIHSAFSRKTHNIEDIFKLGFDSYLPKPFTKQKLQSILERYLNINLKSESIKIDNSQIDKVDIDEFLAIYADSDKIIDRYLKENRIDQAISMVRDLKNISLKIKANDLIKSIDKIEKSYKEEKKINSDLIYDLSNVLKNTKEQIIRNY
jgi:CheY-like chemotaxis protein